MRFVLDVDLEAGRRAGKARVAELGRILRYRAGAKKPMRPPLAPGDRQDLSDSGHTVVGSWRIEGEPVRRAVRRRCCGAPPPVR